jgi:hypothetical protein
VAQDGRLTRGDVQGFLQDEVDQVSGGPLRHDQTQDTVVVGTAVGSERAVVERRRVEH